MPTPKFRTSKSKKNSRRSHHALKVPGMSICPNCKSVKMAHSVCSSCGFYRGVQRMPIAVSSLANDEFGTSES